MRKRVWSVLMTLALLLTLLPSAAFAAEMGSTVYTDSTYKGGGDNGTASKPYADFTKALQQVAEGGTIIVQNSAYINDVTNNDAPVVIQKAVTIKGADGEKAGLNVRAGGLVLSADVTLENLDLNYTGMVRPAIFANGHKLTLKNVSIVPGTRTVHLFGGGVNALGTAGTHAVITLENTTLGNLYAGGLGETFQGAVSVVLNDCTVGGIYGGGTADLSGSSSAADAAYGISGALTVSMTEISASLIDGNGASGGATAAIGTTGPGRNIDLKNLANLAITKGTVNINYSAEESKIPHVSLENGAKLDLSASATRDLGTLDGGGTLIVGKEDTLNIDTLAGTHALEITGGNPATGTSGIANYEHLYIRQNGGSGSFTFQPHATQSGMKLEKAEGSTEWKTTKMPDVPETVKSFSFPQNTGTISAADVSNGGAEIAVAWQSPNDECAASNLAFIPLRYEVTAAGTHYTAQEVEDIFGDEALGIADLGMYFSVTEDDETQEPLINVYGNYGAGTYSISVFAPDDKGGEIQADYTLIVTADGETSKTETTVTVTASENMTFGASMSLNAEVKAGETTVADPAVEYYLNGQKLTGNPVTVLPDSGFKLGENHLHAVYSGDDTYAPSVAAMTITVSKAEHAVISGFIAPSDSVFNAAPRTVSTAGLTVAVNGTELDNAPSVTITYQKDGQTVDAPLFPGTYSMTLSASEGETYTAISHQDAGTFTITAATPTVTVTAEENPANSGTVVLTAAVKGIDPYFATGTVNFQWDGNTVPVTLTDAAAEYTIRDTSKGEHTYRVSYTPDENSFYLGADSGAVQSITVNGAANPPATPAQPAAIRIFKDGNEIATDRIAVPGSGSTRVTYTAKVYDQNNTELADALIWEITSFAGISVADGVVTVESTAAAGSVTLTAGSKTDPTVTASVVITLTKSSNEGNTPPSGGDTPPSGGNTPSGGSNSGSTSDKTETVTNPDGSTTMTETKKDGTTVETTTKTDGTKLTVETKKDGTVTETEIKQDGSKAETITSPDGSSVSERTDTHGSTATVKTDTQGRTEAETRISENAVAEARKNNIPVTIPVEVKADKQREKAPTIHIELAHNGSTESGSGAEPVNVEIPVSNASSGTVVVIVHEDGTEQIVKDTLLTENGVQIALTDHAQIKIVDNSKTFTDTESHWSKEDVNFVAARELFKGNDNGSFDVEGEMTRGMVNTVLARLAGVETDGGETWYSIGTEWAKENGISDGSQPDAAVTREQLVTMLYRYAGSPEVRGSLPFADGNRVSDYARDAMIWAVQNGIINGLENGCVAPEGSATRSQVAAVLARFLRLE